MLNPLYISTNLSTATSNLSVPRLLKRNALNTVVFLLHPHHQRPLPFPQFATASTSDLSSVPTLTPPLVIVPISTHATPNRPTLSHHLSRPSLLTTHVRVRRAYRVDWAREAGERKRLRVDICITRLIGTRGMAMSMERRVRRRE